MKHDLSRSGIAAPPSRALIVKLGAIGDVVMAIPAVYALHVSGVEIDWICGQAVAPVLACYPWIHPIVADERAILKGSVAQRLTALAALWKTIARVRYTLCATLYYDRRYRLIALPVRAERKLALSNADRNLQLLPGRHHTDEYARILLGVADGERPTALAPVPAELFPASPLPRSAEGTVRQRVVIAAGGAKNLMRDDALRRWPVESYAALAQALLNERMEVVLIGGPEDAWVQTAFRGIGATDLIGRLTLPETLALLDDSDVFVTHDTGPLHLAGITRTAIVSIFGPTDPRGRLPQRPGTIALWGGEGFACRPCYDGRDYAPCLHNGCVRQVTPQMVFDEISALLEAQNRGQLPPPRVVTPASTAVSR